MRRGNNYSGARWAFSDRTKQTQTAADGLSIMGGSNRSTTVHRDGETCRYGFPKGRNHTTECVMGRKSGMLRCEDHDCRCGDFRGGVDCPVHGWAEPHRNETVLAPDEEDA